MQQKGLFGDVKKIALEADGGTYRYWLVRQWSTDPPLIFVMLNPSVADSMVDDPTIRKCMHYAKREQAGGIHVINLFAFRTTQPDRLLTAADPVGPMNHAQFQAVCEWPHDDGEPQPPIVLAWGAIERFPSLVAHKETALGWLDGHEGRFRCLGVTKKSVEPRHPLYLRNDAPLQPWAPRQ